MNQAHDNTERLGRYELLTRLARGGMAEILLARETGIGGLERLVVIKRILPEYAEDPDFTEMFLREARIVARINDPNVVQVFELGEEGGDYFMAMEYIDGLTIAELVKAAIKRGTWFSLPAAVAVVQQACKGLHEVHEVRDLDGELMGLIHRDVSHQNFMTDGEGFVKLIDFGIAKSTRSQKEATHSGAVKGKYAYMSPEQCSKDDLDRRSDIFSLGIVAWELFAGTRLFKREDKLATIRAITQEQIPPPSQHNPSVPETFDRVVARALKKNPNSRYQTAADFREAVLEAAREHGIPRATDPLGSFVHEAAGDLLEDRRRKRREVLEQSDPSGIETMPLGDRRAERSGERGNGLPNARLVLSILLGAACLGLAVAGWYVLAGPTDATKSAAASEAPVTIAWPPIIDEAVIERETAPIWKYLEGEIGRPVELAQTNTYNTLSERVRAGQYSYAMMPPLLYVRARDADPNLTPLVVREFDGATSIDGVLLVRSESEIEKIEGLEGKRICHPDRNSTTGYFLPRAHFLEKGYDPSSFLGPPQWSGGHVEALQDLIAGRCAAAATSSGSLLTAPEFGIASGELRSLAVTGTVPQDALVAGPAAPEKLTRSIREALLAFEPESVVEGDYVSEKMKITGFSPVENEAYDELREKIREVEE